MLGDARDMLGILEGYRARFGKLPCVSNNDSEIRAEEIPGSKSYLISLNTGGMA